MRASVFWPVLDAGRYAARTREAQARAEQAAAAYDKAVQNAWREVADALDNLRAAAESEANLNERLAAARETLRITRLRYEAGYSAYLEVLDAQRSLFAARQALVQVQSLRAQNLVAVYRSLGGGN